MSEEETGYAWKPNTGWQRKLTSSMNIQNHSEEIKWEEVPKEHSVVLVFLELSGLFAAGNSATGRMHVLDVRRKENELRPIIKCMCPEYAVDVYPFLCEVYFSVNRKDGEVKNKEK